MTFFDVDLQYRLVVAQKLERWSPKGRMKHHVLNVSLSSMTVPSVKVLGKCEGVSWGVKEKKRSGEKARSAGQVVTLTIVELRLKLCTVVFHAFARDVPQG